MQYDVIVVGAGPGGTSTATTLATGGLQVLLLDKAQFPRDKTCGDGLTPRAITVLRKLGVLEQIQRVACQVNQVEIIAPGGLSAVGTVPLHKGFPNYLLVAKRLHLDALLLQHAIAAGAKFLGGRKVVDIQHGGGKVVVDALVDERVERYQAKVVVLAIGASMGLLRRIGMLNHSPRLILAARTYFEEIQDLPSRLHAYTDGVPIPGYGWVFPLNESSANIGMGFFPRKVFGSGRYSNASAGLRKFLASPQMMRLTKGARQVGSIRGYPLRIDFPVTKVFKCGMLFVGEAAGLVNPLTGEGIDLALESGQVAATIIRKMFVEADFSLKYYKAYEKELRKRYQWMFIVLGLLRDIYVRPGVASRVVSVAARDDELNRLMIDILLGYRHGINGLKPRILWRVLRGY